MSLFLPLKRATLLVPSSPDYDLGRKHLFILLTDPICDQSGRMSVLMVSLSSVKPGIPYDSTCILKQGDHPFIRQESYVQYARARIEDPNKLLRGVKAGTLIPFDPMVQNIFARICSGLEISLFTSPVIQQFYRNLLSG